MSFRYMINVRQFLSNRTNQQIMLDKRYLTVLNIDKILDRKQGAIGVFHF